jgi:DNA (cytosine-5)-methyltransferase 1
VIGTSKSAGDIEIFNKDELFEAIEIKLDKPIDTNILRIAKEKIIKYNPKRYYIIIIL